MKNKLIWHQIFLFGGLTLLLFYKIFVLRVQFGIPMLWWLVGAIFGFALIFTDRFLYVFLVEDEPLSIKVREIFKQGSWNGAVSTLLNERREQKQLAMRSVLFVMVWAVLAIFTATSSSSQFARGFMLGIGMHLVFDLLTDFWWDKEKLELWFWQIKRRVPEDEKKMFVGIVALVFLFLSGTL